VVEFLAGAGLSRIPMLERLPLDCRARLAGLLRPCFFLPQSDVFGALDIGLPWRGAGGWAAEGWGALALRIINLDESEGGDFCVLDMDGVAGGGGGVGGWGGWGGGGGACQMLLFHRG
jgi:hypothetical protein